MLKSYHSSLNLLVAHKHHNVPGAQTKEGRHEPKEGNIKCPFTFFALSIIKSLNFHAVDMLASADYNTHPL